MQSQSVEITDEELEGAAGGNRSTNGVWHGYGKTTLVRMLLGFTIPQSGEILIDEIPLGQLAIRS